MMRKKLYKRWIFLLGLILLTAVACGYGPDTSLPTDNVGPMLTEPTAELTEWSPGAYRLVLNYREDLNEFWVLDVEEPTLYTWNPSFTYLPSIVNSYVSIFYDMDFNPPPTGEDIDQTNFTGMIISHDGEIARLPVAEFPHLKVGSYTDGPWFSPDGRWRVHYSFGYGLYDTSKPMVPRNEERLEFGSTPSVSVGFAWVLDWSPENTQFVMTTQDDRTFLFGVDGKGRPLPGEAGAMSFERGQWLSDGRLILMKDEMLFSLDMNTETFQQLPGVGRVTWFSFSPDLKYLATHENVDCEYRADDSSWFPGNEYCNDDFFLYNGNIEDRQRLTKLFRYQLHNPVWLPIEDVSPFWEIRVIAAH